MVTYWDIVLAPLKEGDKVVGILNVAVDATERVKAERALREREAVLRSILESARNFAVYQVAVDPSQPYGGRVVVSPSIREITGVRDPYCFACWFENVHPEDLPRAVEANRRAMESGEPYSQPVRIYHPEKGQWIWVHTASTPVFDESGRPTHFNGLVVDITEQKRAEEELQRAHQLLEKRVEERTWELATLLEAVKEASGSLELSEVLRSVARGLASAVGVRHCGIYLVDEERYLMMPVEGADSDSLGPKAAAFRIRPLDPSRDRFAREVLEKGLPVVCQDVEADPRTDKEVVRLLGLKSILGVPFVVKGRVVAVAMLSSFDAPHAFTEEQVQLAQGIASTVALAIDNARLYGQAKEKAALEERTRLARELHDSVT